MPITPTAITTEDQIYLTGSLIHLKIRNAAQDATIEKVRIEIYIWVNELNTPDDTPLQTLEASKVSKKDDYISFQISEVLASYIGGTRFSWIAGNNEPSIIGEAIFWQIKAEITSSTGVEIVEGLSNVATNGYRYDFEQVGEIAGGLNSQPYLGIPIINYKRNYINEIKYFKRSFDLTKTLAECTTQNIIKSEANTPTYFECQKGDKYLIVYINRLGLWDYYTPLGKVVKSTEVESETTDRLYRNPSTINNSVNHSKRRRINQSSQKYVINTGYLHEDMIDQVEEVIFAPMVYLIKFTGEKFTEEQQGITVDSTEITVDSTIITVDGQTVTSADFGLYSDFRMIPVINDNKDFIEKNRLNNKGKINFDLQFISGTDRVNNR